MDANDYVKSGEYLPEFMRDFHDQKDLFKAIYDQYTNKESVELFKRLSWVDAHIFTVDVFLWWMGQHGYKLQKVKKKNVEFLNPKETIEYYKDKRFGRIK